MGGDRDAFQDLQLAEALVDVFRHQSRLGPVRRGADFRHGSLLSLSRIVLTIILLAAM